MYAPTRDSRGARFAVRVTGYRYDYDMFFFLYIFFIFTTIAQNSEIAI